MITSKKTLRESLRKKRRSLTLAEQQALSASIAHTFLRSSDFKKSEKIALYLAQEMEVDLGLVIQQSWLAGKTIYLPVLTQPKKRAMKFCAYTPSSVLTLNAVNILEPSCTTGSEIDPSELDLILLPVVGFDLSGHRLGRGGGYYDTALEFCHQNQYKKVPLLIGVAYEFQKIDTIATNRHDVNLSKVITEKKGYTFD